MTEAARLSIPVTTATRAPKGKGMLVADGRVDGRAFCITVTESEIHFAFENLNAPAFSIDLNRLVKDATDAIEVHLFGQRSATL